MTWTPDRIDELTRLWNTGHSASMIGKKLGVSKNAVVGKAHRLSLPARPSPIRKDARPAPRRRPAALPTPLVPEGTLDAVENFEAPKPTRLAERRSGQSCQWPIGDPNDKSFHFCSADALPGKPYCSKHCASAYIKKDRDRDRSRGESRVA